MKDTFVEIDGRKIGYGYPMYTIAEIGSNFDGDIERAKHLIDLAIDYSGADAVKFQSFKAEKIVSAKGFENRKDGFQSAWKKPVYEVYRDAEFPRDWHHLLFDYCNSKGVTFLSAPYDFEAVDLLENLGVQAYKIGSGDITWLEFLEYVGKKNKPVIISTGASTMSEVDEAVRAIKSTGNDKIVLLQCVTNYPSTFDNANLLAMKSMGDFFNLPYGYSDHTPGNIVAVGARVLGGCLVEKHFTDDKTREGPDHGFAMDHHDFKEMVENIRIVERSLGDPFKRLYEEEKLTSDLQRRCLRASRDIDANSVISIGDIDVLRPAPNNSIMPKYKKVINGKKVNRRIRKGDIFTWEMFNENL